MRSSIRLTAICAIALLSVLPLHSQTRTLDGFPGIPFGATGDQVRTEMAKQEGVIFFNQFSILLPFGCGQFAERDVRHWLFFFDECEFFEVFVDFDTLNSTPLDTWDHLRRILVEQYGQPERETFLVISGAFPTDPTNICQNLPQRHDTAMTFWTIPSATSTVPNTIRLYLYRQPDGSMHVRLTYNCESRAAVSEQRWKERAKPRITTITVEHACGPRRSVQMLERDAETTEALADPGLQ